MKKRKLKIWVKILILIVLIASFSFSAYNIIEYIFETKKTNELTKDIIIDVSTEEVSGTENAELINPPEEKTSDYWTFINTPYVDVNFDELMKKNDDTVAWIKINNTNINYPIVQSENNTRYLKKAFDGSYNSAGWLFMDYRNDSVNFDTNTIVYGHSMLNTTMFGTLMKVKKSQWYTNKENWTIKLSTPTKYTLWQIFSFYTIEAENYYITTDFSDDNKIDEFFSTLLSRSKYNFNTSLKSNDKILTLSTCSSGGEDRRFVVHAKLIKTEAKS